LEVTEVDTTEEDKLDVEDKVDEDAEDHYEDILEDKVGVAGVVGIVDEVAGIGVARVVGVVDVVGVVGVGEKDKYDAGVEDEEAEASDHVGNQG